ncbi:MULTISPECIES: tetratricopeptide repeat protein [unclassified Pseudodesulfovibrio]|uniref:tetratricopeptide repeat protein n=1 Tax=unclassified Pseudodesulfovibrio TaxID=2661612 RepID=UPI0013E3E91E|nr:MULTISPECIES: tetratricopeptide repeat protein [unclassified Pseudodesulfovibrio]MCJ2165957.1 tetratricopeptide repeat protein [Pseudodesulfovibrio sp. S3-i]
MDDDFFALHLDSGVGEGGSPPPSGWSYLAEGRVRCVFSTTRRGRSSQTFWFVEQAGRDKFKARPLNDRHIPSLDAVSVSAADLTGDYTPELAYFEELVIPAMRAQGGKTNIQASTIDANVVNALFGLGLVYLNRHETDRARELLGDLVRLKTDFEGKNQFLFNDLGIVLRKSGLYPEAIAFFSRALEYVGDDENLYYNLARAHYENNDWEKCLEYLIQSHRLNPELESTRNLFGVMIGLDERTARLERYHKPPVPPHVASRARQILAAGTGRLKLDEGLMGVPIEPGRARSGKVGTIEIKRHGRDD